VVVISAFAQACAYATPPPPLFRPILPLTFDRKGFKVPKAFTSCRAWNEPSYVASTSGSLASSEVTTLTPNCAAVPVSGSPKLYIIAVQLQDAPRGGKPALYPRDFGTTFYAAPIAGPVNASAEPWIFAPIHGGLALRPGARYYFFVALAQEISTPKSAAAFYVTGVDGAANVASGRKH